MELFSIRKRSWLFHRQNRFYLEKRIKAKQNCNNLTFSKATLLHAVPVVQEFKEVVPSWEPAGTDCSAIQFTWEVPPEPSPNSRTQTVNPFLFKDSTQIAAPFPPVDIFAAWLLEMKTLISCPPLKGFLNETLLQANRLEIEVVRLDFPALIISPVKQTRTFSNNTALPVGWIQLRILEFFYS